MRLFLASLLVISAVVLCSFEGCKMPSCCKHDNHQKETTQKESKPVARNTEQPVTVTITSAEEFNELIKKPTVIKFTATWCTACTAIQPTYEKVAEELHSKYQFATLDVDAFPELAEKYHIRGMPTFLFFNQGKKMEGHIIGANIKYIDFLNKVEQALGSKQT